MVLKMNCHLFNWTVGLGLEIGKQDMVAFKFIAGFLC